MRTTIGCMPLKSSWEQRVLNRGDANRDAVILGLEKGLVVSRELRMSAN